ncbi:hypothetical protein GCM10017562_62730 [Streptomyces roseofulvus]
MAVKGASGTPYTIQQKSEDSTSFDDYVSRSTGVTSRPAAVTDAAGRVQIFYRGSEARPRGPERATTTSPSRARSASAARSSAGPRPHPGRTTG